MAAFFNKPPSSSPIKLSFLCLACLLWVISIFIGLQESGNLSSWKILQETSANFLVRCHSSECSTLILPLLGYALNIYESSKKLILLVGLITSGLGIYYCFLLFKTKLSNPQIAGALGAFAILEISIVFGFFLPEVICSALCMIISSLKAKLNDKSFRYFVIGTVLFDAVFATIIFIPLIAGYLLTSTNKKMRRILIETIKHALIGYLIIGAYLMMIDYNFLRWDFSLHSITPMNSIIIYIGTLTTLFFIDARQTTL